MARGDQLGEQRLLERGDPAPLEELIVVDDVRDQPLLRRHRQHAVRVDAQRVAHLGDLAAHVVRDLLLGPDAVPQRVDLVERDEAGVPAAGARQDVVAPRVEVALAHAGVDRQHVDQRVRARQQVERELGLVAERVQPRRVEDDEALREQRVREVDDRVPPARDLDHRLADDGRHLADAGGREVVAPRLGERREARAADLRERVRHLLGVARVERQRQPLRVLPLEVLERGVGGARLDLEEADRRRCRGVPAQLGRAHRAAPRERGQEPAPEPGGEERVDQLGFPARELAHDRDREPVGFGVREQALDPHPREVVEQVVRVEPAGVVGDALPDGRPPRDVLVRPLEKQSRAHVVPSAPEC